MDFNLSWLQNPAPSQYIAFSIMYISGVFISCLPISKITGSLYLLMENMDDVKSFKRNQRLKNRPRKKKQKRKLWEWKYSRNQSAILGIIERALSITE